MNAPYMCRHIIWREIWKRETYIYIYIYGVIYIYIYIYMYIDGAIYMWRHIYGAIYMTPYIWRHIYGAIYVAPHILRRDSRRRPPRFICDRLITIVTYLFAGPPDCDPAAAARPYMWPLLCALYKPYCDRVCRGLLQGSVGVNTHGMPPYIYIYVYL